MKCQTRCYYLFAFVMGVLLILPAGCSKEKMEELASKAQNVVSDVAEKGGEALKSAKDSASKLTTGAGNLMALNGKANISIDGSTDFPASFVRVVSLPNGKNVVQLKSYKDGEHDSFPSFLIQGEIDQSSVDGLSGQTVSCRLFAQKSDGSAVWTNAEGQMVSVQFQKTDSNLTASFSNASLVNQTTKSESTSSGTFECVNLE